MTSKEALKRETITRMVGVNPRSCMKCGKCTASCPAFEEMEYHPHQFVSMIAEGNIEKLIESKGLEYCLGCFACLERCPRGVEPTRFIEAVRDLKLREQGASAMKAEDVPLVLDKEMPGQLFVSAFRKYTK